MILSTIDKKWAIFYTIFNEFCFMLSIEWNLTFCRTNRKKTHGARSGEYSELQVYCHFGLKMGDNSGSMQGQIIIVKSSLIVFPRFRPFLTDFLRRMLKYGKTTNLKKNLAGWTTLACFFFFCFSSFFPIISLRS